MKRGLTIIVLFWCLIAVSIRYAASQTGKPNQDGNGQSNNPKTTLQKNYERWLPLLQVVQKKTIDGDYKQSEQLAEQLRSETEIAEKSDPTSAGIAREFRAKSLQFLGTIRMKLGATQQASKNFQESIQLFEAVDPGEEKYWGDLALCFWQLGRVPLLDHRYVEAVEYFDKALSRFALLETNRQFAQQYKQNAEFMQSYAICLGDSGHAHNKLGQEDLALKEFERALVILRQYDFKSLLGPSKFELAFIHGEIASIQSKRSQWSETLSHATQATLIYKQGDKDFKKLADDNIIFCEFELGKSLIELGLYKEAESIYTKLYAWYRTMATTGINAITPPLQEQKRKGEIRMASCIVQLGLIDDYRGMSDSAIKRFRDALKIYERYEDAHGKAICYANLADIFIEKSSGTEQKDALLQAKEYLQESQKWSRKATMKADANTKGNASPNPLEEAINALDLAVVNFIVAERHNPNLGKQEYEDLLRESTRTSDIFKAYHDDTHLLVSYLFAGIAYRQLTQLNVHGYSLNDAKESFGLAIQVYESFSTRISLATVPELFSGYGVNSLYTYYAEVLLQMHMPVEDAFAWIERGRGMELAHQAKVAEAKQPVQSTPEVTPILKQLEFERTQAWKKLKSTSVHQSNYRGAFEKYQMADVNYLVLLEGIFSQDKYLIPIQTTDRPTGKEIWRLALEHKDTLYLEWSFLPNGNGFLYAMGAKDGIHIYPIHNTKSLSSLCGRWRKLLSESVPKEEMKLARKLYDTLIGPVAAGKIMQKYDRLVLVPDGPLWNIPFAALQDPKGARLVESYPISITVSVGSLLRPMPKRSPKGQMFCVADFSAKSNGKPSKLTPEQQAQRDTRLPLRYTQDEQKHVQALFPKNSRYLSGMTVSEGEVKKDMPNYSILYFAVHGQYVGKEELKEANKDLKKLEDQGDGLSSYLLMAPERYDSAEDGRLEAREVMNMHLNADLAILSACKTGTGELRGGDGLIGLTWAFQVAGCPSVVSSLWSVNDPETANLMTAFLQNLRQGSSKDVALQKAMIAQSRRNPGRACWWAAFEVFGDTSPLSH